MSIACTMYVDTI